MAKPRPKSRSVFASNLRKLVADAGDTNRSLGKRAGISPRQVSNILNENSAPTIETAEALAAAYGLRGWILSVADLPLGVLKSSRVDSLVKSYLDAPPEAQTYLLSVAERESRTAA